MIEKIDVWMFPDGRMDAKNASKYMGLSAKTLAMMRCNGTGPKFLKKGHIFYYREDVDLWLNSAKKVVSTAELRSQKSSNIKGGQAAC